MEMDKEKCDLCIGKNRLGRRLYESLFRNCPSKKINLIWLEATGCSGNIISFLNVAGPDFDQILKQMVNLRFDNSLMQKQGEAASEVLMDTLNDDFILVVEGAVATREPAIFNVLLRWQGRVLSALETVRLVGERATHVLAVGTCASYGGISTAHPNPAVCRSVPDVLEREVIRLPGCPCHPDWLAGTLAYLILYGKPELDADNRPLLFYGITIHDRCPRRSFFDRGIFAKKLGEETCMFQLGCRGPVTKADCPVRQWNDYVNWPIGADTPCIGCAHPTFPDGMEPFINYRKGGEGR